MYLILYYLNLYRRSQSLDRKDKLQILLLSSKMDIKFSYVNKAGVLLSDSFILLLPKLRINHSRKTKL